MPRNSAGEFYLTPGTAAVRDQVAHSAHVNQRFADLQFDANFPRPLLVGGTGASTAAQARINLGVPATSVVALLAGVNIFQTRQEIDTPADTKLRFRGTGTSHVEAYSAVSGQRVGVLTFDNTADLFRIYLDPAGGQPSARLELNRDGTLKINGSTVYHTGNTPSAADVIPKSVTAVGAIAFLRSTAAVSVGVAYAGSTLTVAGVTSAGALHVGASVMAGQWRALGACPANGATLFLRIN